jgi:hypothetical protein
MPNRMERQAAAALYAAMKRKGQTALVQGDPSLNQRTLIDGTFDLRAVARDLLRALDYSASDANVQRTSSGTLRKAE